MARINISGNGVTISGSSIGTDGSSVTITSDGPVNISPETFGEGSTVTIDTTD